jgi:hypothetical protein
LEHIPFKLFSVDQATKLEFAVIIPVLNERDNIAPLLNDIAIALGGICWEAVLWMTGRPTARLNLSKILRCRTTVSGWYDE